MKKYKQAGTAFTRQLADERKAESKKEDRRKRKKLKNQRRREARKRKSSEMKNKSWFVAGRVDYYAYIVSPEWKEKRLGALQRDDFKCQECRSDQHLQVHHLTYCRLGWEKLEDLQTLCVDCHTIKHEDKGCLDSLGKELKAIIG